MVDDATEILDYYKRMVDEYILDFLPSSHRIAEVDLLYKMLREYPRRPRKGLRSALCLLTCEAFGGGVEAALVSASSLELFHDWVLIHDDIEDGSDLRRGGPSLHREYGVPLAINAGDALHAKMWRMLLANERLLGQEKAVQIFGEFCRMIDETTEGQHMELGWMEKERLDLNEEDYYTMVEKKSSWFTCVTPCRLGALIAGAPGSKLDQFIPFGVDLGIAFQIKDDVLNIVGDEAKYGKESAGDLWEGKRTLLLLQLLKACSSEERDFVMAVMVKKRWEKRPEEIRKILELMREYKVVEYAEERAKQIAARAKYQLSEIIGDLPRTKAKESLIRIVDFMVQREW